MKQWCTNYKFSQNEFASRYSTHKVTYTRHVFFAHLSFQTHDPTQPTKNTIFDQFPTQPKYPTQTNPTQPAAAGQPNPWTTLMWRFNCYAFSNPRTPMDERISWPNLLQSTSQSFMRNYRKSMFTLKHNSLTNLGGNLSDQLSTQGHGQGQRASKPAD